MKKVLTNLTVIAFVAVMSMGLGSCGNSGNGGNSDKKDKEEKQEEKQDDMKDKILGEWQLVEVCVNDECEKITYALFTFKNDGTFEFLEDGDIDTGKWSVNEKNLTLECEGDKTEFWIKRLDDSMLFIKSKFDGEFLAMKRP